MTHCQIRIRVANMDHRARVGSEGSLSDVQSHQSCTAHGSSCRTVTGCPGRGQSNGNMHSMDSDSGELLSHPTAVASIVGRGTVFQVLFGRPKCNAKTCPSLTSVGGTDQNPDQILGHVRSERGNRTEPLPQFGIDMLRVKVANLRESADSCRWFFCLGQQLLKNEIDGGETGCFMCPSVEN